MSQKTIKKDIQMANENMKSGSTSYVIKEMQTETAMKCY